MEEDAHDQAFQQNMDNKAAQRCSQPPGIDGCEGVQDLFRVASLHNKEYDQEHRQEDEAYVQQHTALFLG